MFVYSQLNIEYYIRQGKVVNLFQQWCGTHTAAIRIKRLTPFQKNRKTKKLVL